MLEPSASAHTRGPDLTSLAQGRRVTAMRRAFFGMLILIGVVALALLSGRAGAETTPPTLTGEFFSDQNVEVINATCNPGGTSTISYYTTGTAVGPYPGTYTESGTVTVGAASLQEFVNGL